MKEIIKHENIRVLRFDPDEEAVSGIISYCEQEQIKAAWVSMIGACKDVTLSYYNLQTKEYEDLKRYANLEVLPVIGNISTLNHKTIMHIHGSFSDKSFNVIGGHVKTLIVSATLEVRIEIFEGEIIRKPDEFTGLNLMD